MSSASSLAKRDGFQAPSQTFPQVRKSKNYKIFARHQCEFSAYFILFLSLESTTYGQRFPEEIKIKILLVSDVGCCLETRERSRTVRKRAGLSQRINRCSPGATGSSRSKGSNADAPAGKL